MRLSQLLRNLETEHGEAKDFTLADGEHVVSQQTAQALANLAQFVAVNGIDMARETRDDLFIAVAASLLKPSHPGWAKGFAVKEKPSEPAQTEEQAVTVQKIDPETLWPAPSPQAAEYIGAPTSPFGQETPTIPPLQARYNPDGSISAD